MSHLPKESNETLATAWLMQAPHAAAGGGDGAAGSGPESGSSSGDDSGQQTASARHRGILSRSHYTLHLGADWNSNVTVIVTVVRIHRPELLLRLLQACTGHCLGNRFERVCPPPTMCVVTSLTNDARWPACKGTRSMPPTASSHADNPRHTSLTWVSVPALVWSSCARGFVAKPRSMVR